VIDALGHTWFALYGTDTGMPIAYKFRRLTMSVLAIGGAESTGEGVAGTMLAAPTAFLASYRDGGNRGVGEGAEDRSTASATVVEDTSIRSEGDADV
jgi:pseudouridine-5'-phosphate glycosidase